MGGGEGAAGGGGGAEGRGKKCSRSRRRRSRCEQCLQHTHEPIDTGGKKNVFQVFKHLG